MVILFKERRPKTPGELLAGLEPFRSRLAGKIIDVDKYRFKFFKTHAYRRGCLAVTVKETKRVRCVSYVIAVADGKCVISLDLHRKPFKIYGYPRIAYDQIEAYLQSLG